MLIQACGLELSPADSKRKTSQSKECLTSENSCRKFSSCFCTQAQYSKLSADSCPALKNMTLVPGCTHSTVKRQKQAPTSAAALLQFPLVNSWLWGVSCSQHRVLRPPSYDSVQTPTLLCLLRFSVCDFPLFVCCEVCWSQALSPVQAGREGQQQQQQGWSSGGNLTLWADQQQ